MKKFEKAEIEVIRFESNDMIVASGCTNVCSWDCSEVCSTHDCTNVCIGVQK